jgi:hypothetical protein
VGVYDYCAYRDKKVVGVFAFSGALSMIHNKRCHFFFLTQAAEIKIALVLPTQLLFCGQIML